MDKLEALHQVISSPFSTPDEVAEAKSKLGLGEQSESEEGYVVLAGKTDTKEEVEPLIVNRAVAKRLRASADKILAAYPDGNPPTSLRDGWAARLGWIELDEVDSLTLRKTDAEKAMFEQQNGIAISPRKN